MGGKSKSPDYGAAAIAQGEANREVIRDQTFANRPTQTTPWGQTTWTPGSTIDPSTGERVTSWEQTVTLDPRLQDILNKQIGIQGGRTDIAGALTGRIGEEFGGKMDWSNFSPMGTVPGAQLTTPEGAVEDPYKTRQRAEDAMYSQAMSRLQPQFEAEQSALDLRLRNQGLKPGDAAYDAQMRSAQARQTDATNQALWSSVGEGRAESGQMFGQNLAQNQNMFNQALGANAQNYAQMMQGSQYANQIRQQQIAEAMQQRGQSLNEINALLSGQQVGMPQMPNFSQAQAAQPAPIYQGAVDQGNYNAAMNPWSAILGTAGTLGGAALGNPGLF